jgi:type IV pilus assembly protein PilE
MSDICCRGEEGERSEGFTLIEVIIAVAIVAILAAVAVPGYYNHMMRSRQSEVIGELMSIKAAQEQYFAEEGAYAGVIYKLEQYTSSGSYYYNDNYKYWITADTVIDIASGTIRALGDPNGDGTGHDGWELSIDDLNDKPKPYDTGGTEGFSWSSLGNLF